MSIILQSSGGGSVTIQEPVTASNLTITLPTSSGTAVITGTTPTLNGITFPATAVPSADANTLDDYEEGTWTPSIAFNGASVGLVYASERSGSYTKIGRNVFITSIVALTNKGSSTGNISITGLPFTVATPDENFGGLSIGYLVGLTFSGIVNFRTAAATTGIFIAQTTEAGDGSNLTNSNATNTLFIRVSGTYQAN